MTDFNRIVEATDDNFEGYDEVDEVDEAVSESDTIKIASVRINRCFSISLIALAATAICTTFHLSTGVTAWGIVALIFSIVLVAMGALMIKC